MNSTRVFGTNLRGSRLTVAALCLLAGGAGALACDGEKGVAVSASAGAEYRLVRAADKSPRVHAIRTNNSDATRTFSWSDGKDNVRVTIEGQDIVAHLNGAKVLTLQGLASSEGEFNKDGDSLKITTDDGVVEITFNGEEIGRMDQNEDEAHEMVVGTMRQLSDEDQQRMESRVQDMRREAKRMAEELRQSGRRGSGAWSGGGSGGWGSWSGQGGMSAAGDAVAAPPKVMLGVTLDVPDSDDMPEGFDAAKATLITSVRDDLPAAKAGLQEDDIIVKIQDQDDASPSSLRKILRGKNPGDALSLTIVRHGEEDDKFETKSLSVVLAPFDADVIGFVNPGGAAFMGRAGAERKLEELRAKMAANSEEMQALASKIAGNVSADVRSELAGKMSELGVRMGSLAAELARESAEGDLIQMFSGDDASGQSISRLRAPRVYIDRHGQGGTEALIVPAPPAPPSAASPAAPPSPPGAPAAPAAPVEDINKRLDRLERLLEKLAEEKSKERR